MNEKKIIDELREFVSAVKAMTQRGVGTMAHLDLLLEDKLTELEQKYCNKNPKFKVGDKVRVREFFEYFEITEVFKLGDCHTYDLANENMTLRNAMELDLELVNEPQAEGSNKEESEK